MSKIAFAEDAWIEYVYWQSQDKKTLKKINTLLKELQRTPFEGMGSPEPLKHDKSGKWSRRINSTDRLVYSVSDDVILIYQCKGHYEDK